MTEYQKIVYLLENTQNQPTKYRKKSWIEILRGTSNTNSKIKFKTLMLRSSSCDYSDAYILVSGTTKITGTGDVAAKQLNKTSKGLILKNYAPFTDCISEKKNTHIDYAKYINIC